MKNSTKSTKHNKIRRILAALGAFILFGMYASTLIFALTDHSATQGLLKASIACTFILPVLLYAYTLVYRVTSQSYEAGDDETEDDKASSGD